MRGRTISDADRARARRMMMNESGRTISDADRVRMMRELLGESSRNISDADRAKVDELTDMLKRNDGGMAMKTRVF